MCVVYLRRGRLGGVWCPDTRERTGSIAPSCCDLCRAQSTSLAPFSYEFPGFMIFFLWILECDLFSHKSQVNNPDIYNHDNTYVLSCIQQTKILISKADIRIFFFVFTFQMFLTFFFKEIPFHGKEMPTKNVD